MAEPRTSQNSARGNSSACHPTNTFSEAVCIDVERIYDSCSDKDCLEDLQVYFTDQCQHLIDNAITVKIKEVEVLTVLIDVDEVTFNRGFYSIELTFFFDVTCDIYTSPVCQPLTLHGLATFSKKCILYGSEGNVKTFSSYDDGKTVRRSNMPKVSVSVVDPIALGSRIVEECNCNCNCGCEPVSCIPENVSCFYEGSFSCQRPEKIVYVTLGLFSIISIERDVQLMIPAYDFCIPDKTCDCSSGTADDPCELFRRIKFPTDEFFPPKLNNDGSCCSTNCCK